MKEYLPIKRIYLLVHSFYSPGKNNFSPYDDRQAEDILRIWKKLVDKIAKDPNSILLISPTKRQNIQQKDRTDELEAYARRKLGKRFGFFLKEGKKGKPFQNNKGIGSVTFETFLLENHFRANPKAVKTRGFGEYTNSCVVDYLTRMNSHIGLDNPIPYRNRQSTVLLRESVGADFKPWTLKELMKTPEGRAALEMTGKMYARRRREKVNRMLELLFLPIPHYKPRSLLRKKKKP